MKIDRIASARVCTALATPLIAAVLAGCGSSSSGNGIASKTPQQIVAEVKAATASARSVRVAGAFSQGGKKQALNLQIVTGKGAKGTVVEEGQTLELIYTGGQIYVKGSEAFYQHLGGGAAAQLLKGRWLQAPASDPELAPIISFTNISKLFSQVSGTSAGSRKGAQTTIEGQKVLPVSEPASNAVVYVAVSGPAYPIAVEKTGGESGKIAFTMWNQPVALAPPANPLNLNALEALK